MYIDTREKPEREPDNLQGREYQYSAELSIAGSSHPQRLYEKHGIVMTKSKLY
jgi:hypothetical protein